MIRPEKSADRDAVFGVNAAAFESDAEAKLVDALRGDVEPLISLVAELDGEIVGHILFTPVHVGAGRTPAMALGPMAVLPDRQRMGIGSHLVREGLQACRDAGAAAVFVLGHVEFYPRFGFVPAARYGCHYKGMERPAFFVMELGRGTLNSVRGSVEYHAAFDRF